MDFSVDNISNYNTIEEILSILNNFLKSIVVGDYKFSNTTDDTAFWLLCDGRSLSRAHYSELFNVIGTNYGHVDDEHFNLPDFRGRVAGIIGETNGLTARTFGQAVGEEQHTLTIPQIPSHNHTVTTDSSGAHIHSITDPGHTHTYFNQPNTVNPATSLTTTDVADNVNVNQTTSSSTTGISVNSNGAHTHTFTSNNTGGGGPHNNMQPTLFGANIFILAKNLYLY